MENIILAAIVLVASFIVEHRKAKAKAKADEEKKRVEQRNMEEWEASRRAKRQEAEQWDGEPTLDSPDEPPFAAPDPWEEMVLRQREEEERRAAEEARMRAEAEAERRRMEAEAARRRAKAAKQRRRAAAFLNEEEGARVTVGSHIETTAGDEIGRLTPDDLRRAVILDAIFKRPEF